jgi:hypothetical protein
MEAVSSSKMLGNYWTTRRYIREDWTIHNHRCDNPISNIKYRCFQCGNIILAIVYVCMYTYTHIYDALPRHTHRAWWSHGLTILLRKQLIKSRSPDVSTSCSLCKLWIETLLLLRFRLYNSQLHDVREIVFNLWLTGHLRSMDCFDLFICVLIILRVPHITYYRMMGWLLNNKMKKMWKEVLVTKSVEISRYLPRETYRFHFQGCMLNSVSSKNISSFYFVHASFFFSTLKMEVICSFETSVHFLGATWRYNPEDRTLYEHP